MATESCRNIQYSRKHIGMPLQMQYELQLEELEMCGRYTHGKLHGTSVNRRKLEYSNKHNTDMERINMAAVNNRKLQHECKHD